MATPDDEVEKRIEQIHLAALEKYRNRLMQESIPSEVGEPVAFALSDAIDRAETQISREGFCRIDYMKALEIALRVMLDETGEQRRLVEENHPPHNGNGNDRWVP